MNQELERFEPAEASGRIAYEHLHRYAICRDQVAGQRVLDVACGAGYGTNILAQVAAEATGIDIDAAAIRRAKRRYRRENLRFVVADCYDLPFEAASFDVVVANEMIEHIDDHDRFVEQVKRALRPGGMFLVSTPNKPIYNRYKPPNAFHVSEMDIPEFRDMLEQHFEYVHFVGLRMALVSAGFDLEPSEKQSNLAAAKTYRGISDRGRPKIRNEDLALEDPEYVLAFCSNSPVDQVSTASIYFSSDDDLWAEHEKIMSWASHLHQEDEVLRSNLQKVQSELEEFRADGHLKVSSRLLGKLTGSSVAADPASMIEAMFSLNELIVTQRARLETLAEAQAKAIELQRSLDASRAEFGEKLAANRAEFEREMEIGRAAQAQLQAEVGQAAERIESLTTVIHEVRVERDEFASDLRKSRIESENALREAERLKSESRTLKAETESNTARLETELRIAESDLAKLRNELTQSREQLKRFLPESDDSPAAQRRRDRLSVSRREVQAQLSRSRDAVRGSIPEAVPVRSTVLSRLTRSGPRTRVFDQDWIQRQVPDRGRVTPTKILNDPRLFRVDPHPLFAAAFYLDKYPDVEASGLSPLKHYLEHGWREGRDPHPYFANDWYLQQNPDVRNAGINPLEHYLEFGWKEGRWPNPVFDPRAYYWRHPDVKAAGLEPLSHFVVFGKDEEREVPFMGLERDWQPAGNARGETLLDHLLSDFADGTSADTTAAVEEEDEGSWPPRALGNFWIPQAFRNFLVQRQWADRIPLYTYLYSVMDAYSDNPDEFAASNACARILERVRHLSKIAASDVQPSASIIIPVYNNLLDTLLCIASLLETEPKFPFEIIVADDASNDATADLIPKIGGVVRHIRHSENKGFLGNCNVAAEAARGSTIILLNNDTLPLPGWLEGILAPFEMLDRVGLVGSKLINWDGSLQEAGGIFWKDGSAWNFGRGQDPLDPEFNYLKDVDYCSGASIAIPTHVWRDLGGFDPAYSPAYCEDSDMAFRIRDLGFRTIFSPKSEVVHHEGRSHGRDTDAGIKAYQVTNQERLFSRWQTEIERDHFPNGQNVLRARDRSFGKPHILVVDHYVPQADKDAGSRTMFQFLEALIDAGWAVTFWPQNLHYHPHYTPLVQALGVEVIYGVKYARKFREFLQERAGLYDAVLLSRPHVAVHFIEDVRSLTDASILYYGHDVHFERMKAQREIAATSLDEDSVEAMRTLELDVCGRCDVVLYPSQEEAKLMGSLISKKVKSKAIPAYRFNEGDLKAAEEIAKTLPMHREKASLLFVGGFSHGPNVDGAMWFCKEVVPILRREGWPFELQIAGSNPTAELWDLEDDDIHVLGFVSDQRLKELYRGADAVIAPLRFGAGVKGKVIEAMANGVPVVTTGVGAQGIPGAGDFLFVGDTTEEFAASIRAAVLGEDRRAKAKAALDYVRANYSQSAMIDVLRKVLPTVPSASKAA